MRAVIVAVVVVGLVVGVALVAAAGVAALRWAWRKDGYDQRDRWSA